MIPKNRIIALSIALMLLAFPLHAFGGSIFIGETNDLIWDNEWWNQSDGKSHQDTAFNVNWLVDTYSGTEFIPANLAYLGKWDGGWDSDADWTGDTPYFTGDFSGTAGYWQTTDAYSGGPVYYSLKAGREFELYYAGNDLNDIEVLWDTLGITNHKGKPKALSHLTFWTADNPPGPNPVPEPSTIALFGIGLLMLAAFSRKQARHRQKRQPVPVRVQNKRA